ncbi:MAG: hypothetical protein E6I94_02030 [Chloroflexi bacterium]|nr:MAG: hypothetical protein E6I94_02030 [Chloroflexota bacterium]
MGWPTLTIRRLADGLVPAVGLAALVLVAGLAFGLAPRLLRSGADQALRREVARASGFDRNVQLLEDGRIAVGNPDPLALVAQTGTDLEHGLPEAVQSIVASTSFVVDSPRWALEWPTTDPSFVRFRFQDDVASHVRMVAGRAPTGDVREVQLTDPATGKPAATDAVEGALSVTTAQAFGVHVGDTIPLHLDPTDALVGPRGPHIRAGLTVVGTYTVLEPDAPYWLDDYLLERPSVRSLGGDTQYLDANVLMAPAAYPAVLDLTGGSKVPATGDEFSVFPPASLRATWRYFVDPGRLHADNTDDLVASLRRMDTTYPGSDPSRVEGGTALRSGLLPSLVRQRAAWAAATAVLTVVAIGPAATATSALLLVALLVVRRQRPALATLRGRGASRWQLARQAALDALIVCLPPAVVAGVVAAALMPGGPDLQTGAGAAAAGLLAALALIVSATQVASAPAAATTERPVGWRPPPRRLVAEALVVVLAVAGTYLLIQRGLRGASSTGQLGTVDPFIAAAPALAGAAAGIVAVRLFPIPMRAIAWLAAGRRDIVPVLAMRRLTQGGVAGPVLFVLMAAAAVAAFASTMLLTVDRAAETTAWRDVGAAFRVSTTAGSLPRGFQPDRLPGAERSAGAYRVTTRLGLQGTSLELLAIDVADWEDVVVGTPADPGLPPEVLGTSSGPVPVIVSAGLSTGPGGPNVGDVFEITVQGQRSPFRVVDVRDAFPGVTPSVPFAVVAREQLRAIRPTADLPTTDVYLRAPDSAAGAIREAVAAEVPSATVLGRADRTAALRSSPILDVVTAGILLATVTAALFAALAVAAALALSGAARAIEIAHLRTLGIDRRQVHGLTAVEHFPTVIVALVTGLALGLGSFVALRPGLGLGTVFGTAVIVPPVVDPAQLALIAVGVGLVGVLGVVVGVVLGRRAAPSTAVRRGFE